MPTTLHPFRAAVEAGSFDNAADLFADDVVFHSPVAFKPYEGRERVLALLRLVEETFEDFRYVDQVIEGDTAALIFKARVGEKEVEGLDFIHTNSDGLIDEFTVMTRPLSASIALAEAMGPKAVAAGL